MSAAVEGPAYLLALAGLLLAVAWIKAGKAITAGALWVLSKIADIIDALNPFGNPAGDAVKWIANKLDDAFSSVLTSLEGDVVFLWNQLIDAFGLWLAVPALLAYGAKAAILYLWHSVVKPWVEAFVKPVRALATKAEADVVSLGKKEARDIAAEVARADAFAWKRLADAEGFTKSEVAAARRDLTTAINTVSSYVHSAEAGAEALPGQVGADFDALWQKLRDYIRPSDLEQLLGAGLLSGMLLRVLAQAAGLDNADCQAKHKGICGTDPSKWFSFLEGLALLGFAFDFRELVSFAESIAGDVKPLVEAVK